MSAVLPKVDELNRPFWDGCREGVLRLQRCARCDAFRYPIAVACPHCLSQEARWQEVAGDGEVYTFGVFRHVYNEAWRDRVPYVVALIRLAEGPTLISNVVGVDPDDVRVGLRVSIAFERVDDEITLPVFQPQNGGGA